MLTIYSNYRKFILLFIIVALASVLLWVLIKYQPVKKELPLPPTLISTSTSLSLATTTSVSTTQETKTYRNEELGFEFQYPKEWELEENSFHSPFSKFNLQGDASAKDYNSFFPTFLLNIVTPDFADRAITGWKQSGGIESEIIVDGIRGKKFQYVKPYPGISIILSFEKYGIILATKNKDHESTFNQILAAFKFLKPQQ